MAITQTITTLPAAPDPATMTRDEFSAAAAAYVLAQKAMVPELNTWATEVNAIAGTAVGDVATAIGAAAADTPVDADEFCWRKTATGLLKKISLGNLKTTLGSNFAALAGSASQVFSVANGTGSQAINKTQADGLYSPITGTDTPKLNDFRLTLTSGLPVTTADVTGATNVYMTPYVGNRISLYTSGVWTLYTTAQVTLALGTLTSGLPYDVFAYDNSGVVTLAAVAWTNGTTRATALAYQDGVLCKSGALGYRYLGTFYTTSTTTTEDSVLKRNLWNYYHRKERMMVRPESGTWTYTTASWRQANGSAANQLEAVQGVAEDMVEMRVFVPVQNTNAGVAMAVGIGVDSTTVNSAVGGGVAPGASGIADFSIATHEAVPSAGWHKYTWLEYSAATGTTTWFGSGAAVLYGAMKGKVKA